jgi:hypothetical protein
MVLTLSRSAVFALLLFVIPIAPVSSLHQVHHRYDITGYVLSADGKAIPGVSVVAHLGGERLGSGRSDSLGHYLFRVHLHDSDVGRELRIKTPQDEGSVHVTLTPGDTSTQRIHHVNFIGGKLVEGELSGGGGISTTLVVAGALSVIFLGSIFMARHLRRRRRRQERAEQKTKNRSGSNSRKRKTRKS